MSIVWLWTDILVWILVGMVAVLGWRVAQSRQLLAQWYAIFKSPLAMVSGVVLAFYILLTLLDCLHLKIEAKASHTFQTVSLLDMAFEHAIEATERTYSAPFATHEYSKSIVVDKEGVTTQAYLRLKYVSLEGSIWLKSLKALGVGLGLGVLLVGLHLFWRAKRAFRATLIATLQNQTTLPWRAGYITMIVLIMLLTWCYMMSFEYHVLGTDKVGGDVLYQSLKSIRTGVLIGLLTTLIMLPVAVLLGVSAGLWGGWVDDVIQYLYTTLSSIPSVLLIAAGVLSMQVMMNNHPSWFETTLERSDLRLLFLIVILGVTSWTGLCRVVRAETLKLSQMDFVTASKAFGVGKFGIIRRHIVPNLMHIILISVVLDFSGLVLAEAVLSYVGVGVDPTMHSWGNMINQARLEMAREPMVWWSLFSAFVFMFVLVLSANLLSDRVQKVLDPRNEI